MKTIMKRLKMLEDEARSKMIDFTALDEAFDLMGKLDPVDLTEDDEEDPRYPALNAAYREMVYNLRRSVKDV